MKQDDSEIVKYELQSARKIWESLTFEEQELLFSTPVFKRKSGHGLDSINDPKFDNLVRLGLVIDSYLQTIGTHYDPVYVSTQMGSIVCRYGAARRTLDIVETGP